MATGTVKWFNHDKGFGFISPDDGTEDIFAHVTGLAQDDGQGLQENQRVEFETEKGKKGLQATNIQII